MMRAFLFILAALSPAPVLAQASAEPPVASARVSDDAAALFRKLDTNGDGVLSPKELAAPAAGQGNWLAVDRNRDGRITQDEFGLVRNFASNPPSSAAGGSRTPEKPAKGAGQP